MSSVPQDIYECVHLLSVAMVNATGTGDDGLYGLLVDTLRSYYEEQKALGRSHPFLTEAVADHLEDPKEAVLLYELALAQSITVPGEPKHTKRISLAERLMELGCREQALISLREGRLEAVRCGDTFWIESADLLAQELGGLT